MGPKSLWDLAYHLSVSICCSQTLGGDIRLRPCLANVIVATIDCHVWLFMTILMAMTLHDNLLARLASISCHVLQVTGMSCEVYTIMWQALWSILLPLLPRYTQGHFITRCHTIPPFLQKKVGCKNYWMVIHAESKQSLACSGMYSSPWSEPLWTQDSGHPYIY